MLSVGIAHQNGSTVPDVHGRASRPRTRAAPTALEAWLEELDL